MGTVAVVLVFFWGFVNLFWFGLLCGWGRGGDVAGVRCCLGYFCWFFSPGRSNHILQLHLLSFLAGGNIPCTEDYMLRGTAYFVPKVYLPFMCAVVPGVLLACAKLLPINHFI